MRVEPNGFQVHLLNRSDTAAPRLQLINHTEIAKLQNILNIFLKFLFMQQKYGKHLNAIRPQSLCVICILAIFLLLNYFIMKLILYVIYIYEFLFAQRTS